MVLSRKLFGDFNVTPKKIPSLCFELTPEKAEVDVNLLTPCFKRKLFHESDEDSGLEMDDSDSETCASTNKRQCKDSTYSMKMKTSPSDIKEVVDILSETHDLVADGSRPYVLPTITGKHQDLKSISTQTLDDVVNGRYDDVIDSYRIIDCRYPYEYEGGHIAGAENMYLHETILTLLQQPTTERQILIFHCEFSSERGPKMLRFLRSKDRELNKDNYPSLNYPEIYLLDGGYKAFFYEHSELCEPISYRPMLHSDHSTALRHFRAKSKSWTAGEKRRFARKTMMF